MIYYYDCCYYYYCFTTHLTLETCGDPPEDSDLGRAGEGRGETEGTSRSGCKRDGSEKGLAGGENVGL